MPHLTVYADEDLLIGRDAELIAALTDAVAEVYGKMGTELVHVVIVGIPNGRWGVAGVAVGSPAPAITMGIREAAFERPDARDLATRLVRSLTGAVGAVLGDAAAHGLHIELVATPRGRSAAGGQLVD